jgi:ABC-type uncharacterized transport system involved in gliding motility auxiliary subunit
MMERIKSYSSYVALGGAVLIVAGLVILLVGGKLALQNEIPLAVGVILLAVSVLLNPSQALQVITGRQARYGGNALLISLTFIAILGFVNFLSSRYHARVDLTESKQYSLSPQSIQVLKALDNPVKITAFMSAGYAQELQDLLDEYSYHSDQIEVEIIDPDLKPSAAREYQISSYNTIVYESQGRRQDGFGTTEQDITTSLIKIGDDREKAVYFLTGHGERSITDYNESGLSQLKLALERDSYSVKELNLAITDTIPSDIVALVIARPTQQMLPSERNTIFQYVFQAGSLLVAQDPGYPDNLNELLAGWRVLLKGDVIFDTQSSLLGDPAVPVAQTYPYHLITQDLSMTLFPQAQSVELIEMDSGSASFTPRSLVETSSQSWGETNFLDSQVKYDEGADNLGPLSIGVTIEALAPLTPEQAEGKTSTNSRLAVYGDSDFMSNALIQSAGNQDLALNTLNWLAEQEELVSIRAKETGTRELVLTAGQARVVMYSSMIFLPLIVLALGAAIWWNRR